MASPVRALPRRLGQQIVQTRLSRSFSSTSSTRLPWVHRQCASRTPSISRRGLTSTPIQKNDVVAGSEAEDATVHINVAADEPHQIRFFASDTFARRHIGPDDSETAAMLHSLSPPASSLDEFVSQVIPANIRSDPGANNWSLLCGKGHPESYLKRMVEERYATKIRTAKSFIGQGYYPTITPAVIQRNVLENPAWYTSYTPYQPEISQGRLESLLNFQTMVSDLTALPVSNASLLDEGTAAAEAMTLSLNALSAARAKRPGKTFVVSNKLHEQSIKVLQGRADGFGIRILPLDILSPEAGATIEELGDDLVGVMVQYPDTYGMVEDFSALATKVHAQGALLSCATDLLALAILKPPGEWGADIAFGNAQRFGVPLGFGGPHAAFFSVQQKYARKLPGRLVGVSKDRLGGKAYRLALQTREQHIRREKATSNVCTAQALLANMSAMYGIYHGPEGIKAIAKHVNRSALAIQSVLEEIGFQTNKADGSAIFDTIVVDTKDSLQQKFVRSAANASHMLFRRIGDTKVSFSFDELTRFHHLATIVSIFLAAKNNEQSFEGEPAQVNSQNGKGKELSRHMSATEDKDIVKRLTKELDAELTMPDKFRRTSSFMTHPVFNSHHSETEMLRYIYHLQSKDLSLVHSMIPLGSCTMKLNGTTEMSLISSPAFSNLHPFAPSHYVAGFEGLLSWFRQQLAAITGMSDVSLQPNSGAQGEFAGLRAIREYQKTQGQGKRDICLIPVSAHGTNPASAAMAGMRVKPIKCDPVTGNLDLADLKEKCREHRDALAAIMITYPSTYGVFEPEIRKVCDVVHEHGGQVYMDGANMNAQVGLCSPGDIGADVCHLNLHKTFCIPHGGGGPGVGPICVKKHLVPHLPGPSAGVGLASTDCFAGAPVSSAPYGSASINLISWAYCSLMGIEGLKQATKIGLLNANYLMSRLKPHYTIKFSNQNGRCAHEFIIDIKPFNKTAGIMAIDVAKRLQDYGFHAPTMSFPVEESLMIEPTESESKEELDRFADAMISIRREIQEIEDGQQPRAGNVLKMAPHPMRDIVDGDGEGKWERSYSRDKAAYPLAWLREQKFWPSVARLDDTYGDLNLFCTCPPMDSYEDPKEE